MLLLEKWWQFIASFTILNKKYRITNCSTPADNQSAGVFFCDEKFDKNYDLLPQYCYRTGMI